MHNPLQGTAEHYNSTNRNNDSKNECFYSPSATSDGCAIGRHLTGEHAIVAKTLDLDTGNQKETNLGYVAGGGSDVEQLFRMFEANGIGIPEIFKDIPVSFLQELQTVHDTASNWYFRGISEVGQKNIDYMSKHISLELYI